MATEKDPPAAAAPVGSAPVKSIVALRQARERAIAMLSDAFAGDDLDMEEFERRLGIAHRTDSLIELEQVTVDLEVAAPPIASTALVQKPAAELSRTRERQKLTAVLGGVSRTGYWSPARQVRVVAVMGGAVLDFREAALAPGVTEVNITAVMGGVHIIVPPQLAVEMEGSAIMGGFDHSERAAPMPDLERPVLRVTGMAFWGGVHIETRLPGENEKDAHRRRKHSLRGTRERPALPPHRDK